MSNEVMTKGQLDRLMKLISLADVDYSDVVDEVVNIIFPRMICDNCPMHGKCETDEAMHSDDYDGNIPDDVKSCWITLTDYIYEDEP